MTAILPLALALAQGEIPWKTSLAEGLAQARSEHRLILVHFFWEGRPASRQMDEETLRHPEIIRLSSDAFVSVRIDSARDEDLFRKLVGGRGGLATCVIDETEDVIATASGFLKPEGLQDLLEKARGGYGKLKELRSRWALEPEDAQRLFELGECYWSLASLRRAEECFRRAVLRGDGRGAGTPEDRKSSALGHERLARLLALRGHNREAREHLERYRALDPEDRFGGRERAWLSEAYALAVERHLGPSIELLEKTRKEYPRTQEMDEILVLEGWLWHESGQDARALELLGSVMAQFPKSALLGLARERIEHIKNPPPDHPH